MLGADSASTSAYCADGGNGGVSFSSAAASQAKCSDYQFKSRDYTDITTDTVVVSSVSGTRQTGVTKQGNALGMSGLDAGLKDATYCFTDKDITYVASYTQTPGHADVLATFDMIVTKTLRFTK